MNETYFVIRNSDGDTTVRTISKEQLLKDIEDGEYGHNGENIIKNLPNDSDTNYWGEGILIIKGKMVTPIVEQ